MCLITVIFVLVLIIVTHAKELMADSKVNAQDSRHKLIDKLVHRLVSKLFEQMLCASNHRYTDWNSRTVRKSGHHGFLQKTAPVPLSFSHHCHLRSPRPPSAVDRKYVELLDTHPGDRYQYDSDSSLLASSSLSPQIVVSKGQFKWARTGVDIHYLKADVPIRAHTSPIDHSHRRTEKPPLLFLTGFGVGSSQFVPILKKVATDR